MSCVPFETLVELWAGELPPDRAAAVEEHVFSCDTCAASCERLGAVVGGLRALIPPVISHALRDRMVDGGTRIRLTPVDPGVPVDVTFDRELDLLIHALRADLGGIDQVDLDILAPTGELRIALTHVPFDASRGEVLIACQRHYRDWGGDPTFLVYGTAAGNRRELGSYLVRHHWL